MRRDDVQLGARPRASSSSARTSAISAVSEPVGANDDGLETLPVASPSVVRRCRPRGGCLRDDSLRGAPTAWRPSPSTQPETRNALSNELLSELIEAFELGARRRGRALRRARPPRTRRCSPPAAASTSSPPTCRSCTSTSAPSASRGCSRRSCELGKPTICAANGHVLAGALGLALACDLIVAKEGAGFGTPEINVGRVPLHDHGADLPQRPAQEDQRAAAARASGSRPRRRARRGS